METPSSTRRVTRSQTKATMNGIPMLMKNEESEKVFSRQRNVKPDRSALIDITNDSPIVGLAMGSFETPSSHVKKRDQPKQTPGSGEALLRCQVKTLLQKVEEEAELSKPSFEHGRFLHHLQGIVISPSGLLAPTPANTPYIPNHSCEGDINIVVNGLAPVVPIEVVEKSKVHQEILAFDGLKQEETLESQKSLITRSLLLDFSEKSEISDSSSCSSVLTYQEGGFCQEKSTEEDDASIWSIQVNTSIKDEDEDDDEEEEDQEEKEYDEGDYEKDEDGTEGGWVDDLCQGLSKISVQEKKVPEFTGKHVRFVYNSDDEMDGEEEVESNPAVSPNVLRLKGMPTPKGKHLRFPEEEEA